MSSLFSSLNQNQYLSTVRLSTWHVCRLSSKGHNQYFKEFLSKQELLRFPWSIRERERKARDGGREKENWKSLLAFNFHELRLDIPSIESVRFPKIAYTHGSCSTELIDFHVQSTAGSDSVSRETSAGEYQHAHSLKSEFISERGQKISSSANWVMWYRVQESMKLRHPVNHGCLEYYPNYNKYPIR